MQQLQRTLEEIATLDPQSLCQLIDVAQRDVPLAVLDGVDVGSM